MKYYDTVTKEVFDVDPTVFVRWTAASNPKAANLVPLDEGRTPSFPYTSEITVAGGVATVVYTRDVAEETRISRQQAIQQRRDALLAAESTTSETDALLNRIERLEAAVANLINPLP